eukprot:2971841-Rhodomonas_salina.1
MSHPDSITRYYGGSLAGHGSPCARCYRDSAHRVHSSERHHDRECAPDKRYCGSTVAVACELFGIEPFAAPAARIRTLSSIFRSQYAAVTRSLTVGSLDAFPNWSHTRRNQMQELAFLVQILLKNLSDFLRFEIGPYMLHARSARACSCDLSKCTDTLLKTASITRRDTLRLAQHIRAGTYSTPRWGHT